MATTEQITQALQSLPQDLKDKFNSADNNGKDVFINELSSQLGNQSGDSALQPDPIKDSLKSGLSALITPKPEQMAEGGFDPARRFGQATLGSLYGSNRSSIQNAVPNNFKQGMGLGALSTLLPGGMASANMVPNNIQQEIGKQGVGLGTDAIVGAITNKVGGAGVDAMGAAKNAVSKPLGDFLNPNRLINSEISPKAFEATKNSLLAMEPNALAARGLSPEVIGEIQRIKSSSGITTIPRVSDAEQTWTRLFKNIPEDSKIIPTKTFNLISKLNPSDVEEFMAAIKNTGDYPTAVSGGPSTTLHDLSPQQFENLRSVAVDMAQNGNNPIGSAIKHALDSDASDVIPALAKAKDEMRLSYLLDKVTKYLDNPDRVKIGLNKLIETASKDKLSPEANILKNLTGEDSSVQQGIGKMSKLRTARKVTGVAATTGILGGAGKLLLK